MREADLRVLVARRRAAAPGAVGHDDPRHLVVQPEREPVARQREDAEEHRDGRGAAEPCRGTRSRCVEVEDDLRHGEARAGLDLPPEAVELQVEVVGGRVDGDADEERGRRVDRLAVVVLALVQARDQVREPDRVDLVDAARPG